MHGHELNKSSHRRHCDGWLFAFENICVCALMPFGFSMSATASPSPSPASSSPSPPTLFVPLPSFVLFYCALFDLKSWQNAEIHLTNCICMTDTVNRGSNRNRGVQGEGVRVQESHLKCIWLWMIENFCELFDNKRASQLPSHAIIVIDCTAKRSCK